MTDTQEWQQSNSQRAFPFSETSYGYSGVPNELPNDLFLDLRFFPNQWEDNKIFLSRITYYSQEDEYQLVFRYVDNLQPVFVDPVIIPRLDNGDSIVGKKVVISDDSNLIYCAFTPGEKWGSGTAENLWIMSYEIGGGVFSKIFEASQAMIDESVVVPGAKGVRRIFVQPIKVTDLPILPVNKWGREVKQNIKEGYNICLTLDENNDDTVLVNARGGCGDGYPPNSQDLVIRTINLVPGNAQLGEFKLETHDCLNKIEKPSSIYENDDHAQSITIENTIQLLNDCLPCCGCDKYRAVSAAITLRSLKLKELCDLLSSMILANTQLYNEAVKKINTSRKPIAQIRGLRVGATYFTVSVQNICAIPIYAQIGITLINALGVSWNQFYLSPSDANFLRYNINDLPPLQETNKDYQPSNTPERIPSGVFTAFAVGSDSTALEVKPIMPGGFTDITFLIDPPDLAFDLRPRDLTLRLESNGLYGHLLTYGCSKDVYGVKYITEEPRKSLSCDGWIEIPYYKAIEIEL